jgi:hypothetical protein
LAHGFHSWSLGFIDLGPQQGKPSWQEVDGRAKLFGLMAARKGWDGDRRKERVLERHPSKVYPRAGGVAQVKEYLPTKYKAQVQTPVLQKTNNQTKNQHTLVTCFLQVGRYHFLITHLAMGY